MLNAEATKRRGCLRGLAIGISIFISLALAMTYLIKYTVKIIDTIDSSPFFKAIDI